MNHLNTSKFSYRRLFQIILSRWYWVLASVVIALLLAYIKLSFTPLTYSTDATLKFDERRSEISELINVRNVYERTNKLQSEQFVIRSRDVLSNAIKRMNYDIAFSKAGYFNNEELYPLKPFNLIVLHSKGSKSDMRYTITPLRPNQFILEYEYADEKVRRRYSIGDTVTTGLLIFKIISKFQKEQIHIPYIVQQNDIEAMLVRVNKGLTIIENKNTNILTFKQLDQNPVFAADVLNAVLQEYVDYDKGQKTQSANQTIAFIDTLLRRLSKAVGITGSNFEKFKSKSNILNIAGSSNLAVEKLEALEKQKADLQLNSLRILQLEKDIKSSNLQEIITFSAQDITDPYLSNLLMQYNALLLKKQGQLSTYKPSSETIRDNDAQIQLIRHTLAENISGQKQKNQEALEFLTQQLKEHTHALKSIPTSEKAFVNLQAEFDVNQKVYAYLNQKKLEAQISKASVTPSASIVDKATYRFLPVAPVKTNAYKAALLLGLIIGIGLIFFVRLLNPYLHDRETLELLTSTPVIGVIRKYTGSTAVLNKAEFESLPKSLFSESIRTIRTSISFLAPDIPNKVICITSETSGEGKSFIAMHLAQALTMIDKRVIVLAADLRKSKFHHAFNTDNHLGLSNYLSGQTDLESIIITRPDQLSFIPGGPVPPNPSELLYSQKMEILIQVLRERYDYIIIDSAPIGLVSDATSIIKRADINLFIIRSGLSRYHAATVPERLSKELLVENFKIILNAYNFDTLHSPYYSYNNLDVISPYAELAGYDPGYFGEGDKKKWWIYKGIGNN
jgi:tyrosine-protein kinase Etk/Wzc